jgi:CheY-like chemotaxis protein
VNRNILLATEILDNPWISVIKKCLQPLEELQVTSAQACLQMICQKSFDLVVMDLGDTTQAIELTQAVKATSPTQRIIIATASPTWRRARQALLAGAVDYIYKTTNEIDLRNQIQAAMSMVVPRETGPGGPNAESYHSLRR